ncbi:MAG: hypothetical protein IPI76_16600 [Chloracidobacterium sp.]|nr:hypothetical protein [Chloracidobacterium sp.]MBK9768444.1 hypothetical protein [Chloracidobacterium sp.]
MARFVAANALVAMGYKRTACAKMARFMARILARLGFCISQSSFEKYRMQTAQ